MERQRGTEMAEATGGDGEGGDGDSNGHVDLVVATAVSVLLSVVGRGWWAGPLGRRLQSETDSEPV